MIDISVDKIERESVTEKVVARWVAMGSPMAPRPMTAIFVLFSDTGGTLL